MKNNKEQGPACLLGMISVTPSRRRQQDELEEEKLDASLGKREHPRCPTAEDAADGEDEWIFASPAELGAPFGNTKHLFDIV